MFISFHTLCIIFLSFLHSFTLENERSAVGSQCERLKIHQYFATVEVLHIVGIVWNTSD
jgi:hypothetical protein